MQVRGIRQKLIIHKVASGEEDQHHLPDCHCWCQCLPHCDGISLCFVGEILLCSGRPGFANARAMGIVSQVKDGDNLASLIMAETLLGLDYVFLGGESQNFLGSPLTL